MTCKKNRAIKERKDERLSSSFREEEDGRPSKVGASKTYVDDDHLYVADDEDSVFVGLRDVDVAIRDGDGPSPAAVDSLGPANVVLRNDNNITIKKALYPAAAIDNREMKRGWLSDGDSHSITRLFLLFNYKSRVRRNGRLCPVPSSRRAGSVFFSFSFLLTGCVGNIDGKAAYLCAGHDVRRLDHVQQPAILRLVD